MQWLSSKPIIISTCRDVHTTDYPEEGDNMQTKCITRGFQSCIHVQSGCRLKKKLPPDYIREMIISANWLLKYRMQASYFRLICLSSAVLEARG